MLEKIKNNKIVIGIVGIVIIIAIIAIIILLSPKKKDEATSSGKITELDKPVVEEPQKKDEKTGEDMFEIFSMESNDIKSICFTCADDVELDLSASESGDKWQLTQDTGVFVNQDVVKKILDTVSCVYSYEILSEYDYTEYGFAEPFFSYTITDYSDNAIIFDFVKSGDEYYLLIENDNSYIYRVPEKALYPKTVSFKDVTQ